MTYLLPPRYAYGAGSMLSFTCRPPYRRIASPFSRRCEPLKSPFPVRFRRPPHPGACDGAARFKHAHEHAFTRALQRCHSHGTEQLGDVGHQSVIGQLYRSVKSEAPSLAPGPRRGIGPSVPRTRTGRIRLSSVCVRFTVSFAQRLRGLAGRIHDGRTGWVHTRFH